MDKDKIIQEIRSNLSSLGVSLSAQQLQMAVTNVLEKYGVFEEQKKSLDQLINEHDY